MRNISKIRALEPTAALAMNKKGFVTALLMLAGAALLIGTAGYGIYKLVGDDKGDAKQLAAAKVTVDTPEGDKTVSVDPVVKEATSCDGIASVKSLLDDLNFYKIGTDPASHLSIFEKSGKAYKKVVADDATTTTVPVLSSFKGLAGNNAGTPVSGYFAEIVEFSTVCSDKDIQPELYPSGVPTITITNDNGKTVNSDSNHEAMDASITYTPCMTVKAAAESCASRYGALVVLEYDATYTNTLDSTDMASSDSSFHYGHHNTSFDQFKIMKWNGAVQDMDGDGDLDAGYLCNGKRVDICWNQKITATAPTEDTANIKVHWVPLNYDIRADEYDLIGPSVYDEDNNVISTGNTTTWYYSA